MLSAECGTNWPSQASSFRVVSQGDVFGRAPDTPDFRCILSDAYTSFAVTDPTSAFVLIRKTPSGFL